MLCSTVLTRLSEFFDGALDDEMSLRVSQHLKRCKNCQKELDALANLHGKLNSLTRIPAPEYLHHLVQTRLSERKRNTWGRQIKDAFAFRWSRIRTTDFQFYWTRALGIAMTACCLFVISSSIDPFYTGSIAQAAGRSAIDKEASDRMQTQISRNFGGGLMKLPERNYSPALHDGYLLEFGENATSDSDEDALTSVIEVDPSGMGTIQNVIESPHDQKLLDSLKDTIALARFRPGTKDGLLVSSQLVLKYYKMTVHE